MLPHGAPLPTDVDVTVHERRRSKRALMAGHGVSQVHQNRDLGGR